MKAKTIKSVLRRKHSSWIDSITDESVRELAKENSIITGGSIVSMMLGESVHDYDIYFRTAESVFAVTKYYVDKFRENPPTSFRDGETVVPIFLADAAKNPVASFNEWHGSPGRHRLRVIAKSAGVVAESGGSNYAYFEAESPEDAAEYVESVMDSNASDSESSAEEKKREPYRPVFLTENAITLSDKIQLVVRFFGEAEDIHDNYDFVHCTNYWQSWDGKLYLRPEALECMINKELRYIGSKYPVCSLFRTRKFIERGWSINAGQILKACLQVSDLDLLDVDVLEDQLTGVDTAYFSEVIKLLQEKRQETGNDRIDHAYLVEVIDRIF